DWSSDVCSSDLRPYAVKTGEVLQSVSRTMAAAGESQDEPAHPLLAKRPENQKLFLVFTAGRGLCGGFYTDINKATERFWREKEGGNVGVSFATMGRKGREYLGPRGVKVLQDFPRIY